MGRISGLITEVGSTTCHLASVAREFGVPMAVNVVGAVDSLEHGKLRSLSSSRNGRRSIADY